jgi:hypothetical protein
MKNLTKENRNFLQKIGTMLFIISAISVSVSAQRQQKAPDEFSIFGGADYSFMYYQSPLSGAQNLSSKGFGANLGASFTAFAGKYVGFHIGLGFSMYQVETRVDSFTFVTPHFDDAPNLFGNDQPYDLYTNLSGYYEKHSVYFLSIPVMIQFQTMPKNLQRGGSNASFYAMTGVKVNIPIKRQYEVEVKELRNMAYFTQLGNWAGTQEFAGLGRFKGNISNGIFKNIMFVFTVEAGLKWHPSDKTILYVGAYFDCGLNDPTKKYRKPAGDYILPERLTSLTLLEFYDNNYLMGVGIKLRLAFINPAKCLPCR